MLEKGRNLQKEIQMVVSFYHSIRRNVLHLLPSIRSFFTVKVIKSELGICNGGIIQNSEKCVDCLIIKKMY